MFELRQADPVDPTTAIRDACKVGCEGQFVEYNVSMCVCKRERERDNDGFMCFLVGFLNLSRSRGLVDPDCVCVHVCLLWWVHVW